MARIQRRWLTVAVVVVIVGVVLAVFMLYFLHLTAQPTHDQDDQSMLLAT